MTHHDQSYPAAEVFRFCGLVIDVAGVEAALRRGDLSPVPGTLSIEEWSASVLGLRRGVVENNALGLLRLRMDHVAALSDERLNTPVFVGETPLGRLVFDGNHRIAKAYAKGLNVLPAWFFSGDQLRPFLRTADQAPGIRIRDPREMRRRPVTATVAGAPT